jgi:hypothetical protein
MGGRLTGTDGGRFCLAEAAASAGSESDGDADAVSQRVAGGDAGAVAR